MPLSEDPQDARQQKPAKDPVPSSGDRWRKGARALSTASSSCQSKGTEPSTRPAPLPPLGASVEKHSP